MKPASDPRPGWPTLALRLGPALLLLAFGLLSHDPRSEARWLVIASLLYGLPLAAQLVPRTWVRVYGAYLGVFVLLQALLSTHFFPITYITHRPNVDMILDVRGDNLPGVHGEQRITTDAKGFRTTLPIDYDADEPYRIFFIGSSSVAQDWIDDRKTVSHLLQESLSQTLGRRVEVINTGVPGVRAVHSFATMREVARYHPDMYVILMMGNDSLLQIASHFYRETPNQDEAHGRILMKPSEVELEPLPRARTYTLENTLLGRAISALESAFAARRASGVAGGSEAEPYYEVSHGLFFEEQRGSLFRADQRSFRPEEVSPSFAEALQGIGAFCQDSPAACVVLTQPTGYRPGTGDAFKERLWMTPMFASYSLTFESMVHIARLYNDYWLELAEQWSMPLCDLEAQVEPSLEYFYDDVHFNVAGSRKAADYLQRCLADVIRGAASPDFEAGK
ncbi:MAG: hypothetical protein CL910_21120 [Deltaproteobacteria bacterium]|jgi:hypothetical protein|nr:hypothetical protein [Deltaproteobacteria bacterium]